MLAAAGIAVVSAAADTERRGAHLRARTDRPRGGSTWQSLVRGTGNVETDYLNGEIARIAHGLGREAPLNARLASLVRRAADRGQQPGAVSAAQVAEALGIPAAQ